VELYRRLEGAGGDEVKPIPLMQPYITPAMREAVARTLETRWIGQGPKVEEFERKFSEQCVSGAPCVAVGSGTDALHLAYILAGIGPGDEVVTPLFTCTATSIPLLYQGAKIRFYDVTPGSLNGDARTICKSIDQVGSGRCKAVVVVHYGGEPIAELESLAMTCRMLGIPLIEDCAQALGATVNGRPVGTFGDFACFSFQAVKHVTTGDGGMLVVNASNRIGDIQQQFDAVEKAKRLRWFGIDRAAKLENRWANDIREVGYKYQMTDIAASMGIAALDALPDQLEYRRLMLDHYRCSAAGIGGMEVLDMNEDSAAWLCTVVVDRREDLIRALAAEGIESGQVHYRNDRYSIFKSSVRIPPGPCKGEFPNMDAIDPKYLVLPMHMGMDLEDVQRVCDVIRSGW